MEAFVHCFLVQGRYFICLFKSVQFSLDFSITQLPSWVLILVDHDSQHPFLLDFWVNESRNGLSRCVSVMEVGNPSLGDHKLKSVASDLGIGSYEGKFGSATMSRKCSASAPTNGDSSPETNPDDELALEVASVEAQFQQMFEELSRKKEEALRATRKKWAEKKLAAH